MLRQQLQLQKKVLRYDTREKWHEKKKHSFLRFYLPQLIFVCAYVGWLIFITGELLFVYNDYFLGFSCCLVTIFFAYVVWFGLKERAVTCWNKVVVESDMIQAYSMTGKLLCEVDLNKPGYYSVLKVRDEHISSGNVLVVSNDYIELPNNEGEKFRQVYDKNNQILIIDVDEAVFETAGFIKVQNKEIERWPL